MNPFNTNRCGFCNNFITAVDDIHLIPVGSCSTTGTDAFVDYHRNQCGSFHLKAELVRTVNCSGCNFELWLEFECTCARNYTSDQDAFRKKN